MWRFCLLELAAVFFYYSVKPLCATVTRLCDQTWIVMMAFGAKKLVANFRDYLNLSRYLLSDALELEAVS